MVAERPAGAGKLQTYGECADENEETPAGLTWPSGAILELGLRKGRILDDQLKELMQELGNAINESLSDSERIAAAIGEIKRAGYDVFLVLEATIGFNKREDDAEDEDSVEGEEAPAAPPPRLSAAGKIKWTSQDHKFLRALKISVDDESR